MRSLLLAGILSAAGPVGAGVVVTAPAGPAAPALGGLPGAVSGPADLLPLETSVALPPASAPDLPAAAGILPAARPSDPILILPALEKAPSFEAAAAPLPVPSAEEGRSPMGELVRAGERLEAASREEGTPSGDAGGALEEELLRFFDVGKGHPAEEPYQLSALGFGRQYQDPDGQIVRKVLRFARSLESREVMDLATGRGLTALALARLDPRPNVVATDIDEAGLKEAAQRARAAGLTIETRKLDAATPVLPEDLVGRFDLVVAKDLYPFLNPRQIARFLKNVSMMLKPGGWFLLTAPSTRSDLYKNTSERNGSPGYYQRLSPSDQEFIPTTRSHFSFLDLGLLYRRLKRRGFTVTDAFHYGRARGWIFAAAQKDPEAR